MIGYFAGFALGFSLILAIGAQNAFVLRQGLRGQHVLAVVLTCAISDAILITIGVAGFAAVNEAIPGLAPVMRWGGAAFLFVYGALSFRAAFSTGGALEPAGTGAGGVSRALGRAVGTVLALTWLNPHVYLDTVILMGSISTQYVGQQFTFGLGAVTASFVFFFSLGYGARLLRPLFAKPMAWRVLEGVVGVTMWVIALKLVVL
jgi:L-lysine exporter family protein LysE/ArgO